MQKLYFLGAMPIIKTEESDGTLKLLERTGFNTGNLLIGHSVYRHLAPEKWTTLDEGLTPKQIEDEYDYIVIPASNFLYSGYDLGGLADFIEKVNLPCVMIGVGSQAPTYESKIELQKGTIRFLKVVSERSVSIGARGYFTASWLEKYGIKNVDIIGCPSFFWTCKPTLNIKKKIFSDISRIAFNGSRTVYKYASDPVKMRLIETSLFSEVLHFDTDFFVQNEDQEAIFARKIESEFVESYYDPIIEYYKAGVTSESVKCFFSEHSRIFFNIDSWATAISEYDFSIGTRFHGNMIALQNGVPAVIICHDVRTQELCELLHIPFLRLQDIDVVSLEWLYEMAEFDSISVVYNHLFNNYIDFLERNGLEHILKKDHLLPKSSGMSSYRAVQRLLQNDSGSTGKY